MFMCLKDYNNNFVYFDERVCGFVKGTEGSRWREAS